MTTVRRATVDDAAAFARIMGDPAVYPGLMQMPHTNEEIWRARLAEGSAPGKFGFEVEGRHRGTALRDGRFVDVLSMARLHPAPTIGPAPDDTPGGEPGPA